MWIIIVIGGCFIIFFGLGCVMEHRKQMEKDAREAEFKTRAQARREKIASSPNVANIAQAIVSRCGFPQKIEIFHWGIYGDVYKIKYKSLEIADIDDDDCVTLASALCSHPLLEDKYKMSSNGAGEVWLELKVPASSKTLQEW